MNKYVAVFSVPSSTMQEWMQNTDEAARKEQMDKMMSDWKAWAEAHKDSILDQGHPLGKTKRVDANGVTDAKNDLNYMMIVQADSPEAAADLFKDNPHFMIPTSYVDVMDASRGGM